MSDNNTTIKYPAHYTPDDMDKIRQLDEWLKSTTTFRAQLARQARVSSATLTQIMRGTYISSPTDMLKKLVSAMQNAPDSTSASDAVETMRLKPVCMAWGGHVVGWLASIVISLFFQPMLELAKHTHCGITQAPVPIHT